MLRPVILLLTWVTFAHATETAPPPTREVAVIVTKEGYYPKQFTVFQGERVKFYVTATVEQPDCLIVQGQKVFLAANKGKITEAEAVFEQPGTYAFYCPASKHDGKITVLEKIDARGRKPASGAAWIPKEYD